MLFITGRSSSSSSLPSGALSPIPSRFGPLHHQTGLTTSAVYLVLHSPRIHRFATAHHSVSANSRAYGLVPALRHQFYFLPSSRDATRKTGLLAGVTGRRDGVTRPCAQMHSFRIPRTLMLIAGVGRPRVLRDASRIIMNARAYCILLIVLSKATVSSSMTTNGRRLRRAKEFRPRSC